MLACIKGIKAVAQTRDDMRHVRKGLQIKQMLLNISLISTIGLVGFFLEHRLLCHKMGKHIILEYKCILFSSSINENCFFFQLLACLHCANT